MSLNNLISEFISNAKKEDSNLFPFIANKKSFDKEIAIKVKLDF